MAEQQSPRYNRYLMRYGTPTSQVESPRQFMGHTPAKRVDLSDLLAHLEEKKSALDQELTALENALRAAQVERVVVAKKIEVLTGLKADVAAIRQAPWECLAATMAAHRDGNALLAARSTPSEIKTEIPAVSGRRIVWRYAALALLIVLVALIGTGWAARDTCQAHQPCSMLQAYISQAWYGLNAR